MSNYHTHSIEDYQFTHGHHRIVSSGKYIALHPHFLGRPLTHEEMDFNLLYAEQTLAGFRIFGSNADLTLSDDDLGKSLVFHKIASNDDDFARYTAAGYTEGQYIWIPDCCGGTPIDCSTFQVSSVTATDTGGYSCGDFVVDSITATDSGGADDCISFVVDNIVATDSEGDTSVPRTTATSTLTPTATAEMTPTPTATATATPTPTVTVDPLEGYYTYYMTTPIETLPYPNNQSAQDLYCAPGETITTVVKHISNNVLNMGNAAFFNPDGTPYTLLNTDPGVQYHVLIFRADQFADRNYDIGSNTTELDLRRSGGQYGGHLMLQTDTVPGPGGYLGNVTGAVPIAAAQGWWNEDCPVIPVTPTPTVTAEPTATPVAPTPTPTVESAGADTFNWVVSTDVDSLNRVNYIEENFDNDQYGVWASNEELQLKHYQFPGISFNYFPVAAGQSYYIKLEGNNPNGRFTISSVTGRNALNSVYLFNDDPAVIYTIDSVWNKATDSTRPDVAFLNNNNEAVDNQCAYDNEGLVKIYNKLDTNNGTDSTICSSNGYLNPENYIKIDVPTNASPGEEFTIGWGGLEYWPNWAQGQTGITDTESVGVTQITPGQSTGSIQFRVVENPTEPTVTPTPLPSDNKLPINLVRSIGTLGNVADSTYSDTQAFLIEKNYDPTSWSGVNERTSGNPYDPQTGDILYDEFLDYELNPLPNGTFAFVKAVPLGTNEWFWITTDSNGIMTVTQL